jgi:hypothetical protein
MFLGYALDSPWRVTVAYEYVKSYYGVNPEPGQRVTTKDKQKSGTIARKKSYDQYVYVTFDGSGFSVPCHPLDLEYGK